MNLRPYQQEAIDAIVSGYRRGVPKGLLVLPTGGGKTIVFAQLPTAIGMRPDEKMLVIVHRDELAWQTKDKMERCNPHLRVAIEKADNYADENADVVVASVQTLGRAKLEDGKYTFTERIKRFRHEAFRYVIADEAHHATAPSWRSVLAYFRVLKGTEYDDPRKLFLAVTATPRRADNIGMELICDDIYYRKDLASSIAEGWLTDIKAWRVDTTVDISNVGTSKGDFNVKELERTVNTPARNRKIVEKYIEHGEGQQAICFTVDVQHAIDITEEFNRAGIKAMYVTGNTPTEERRRILRLHKERYFTILSSCGVLTEGYDDPNAMVALMARPTKSGTLYTQSVGRVLRPAPAPEEIAAMSYRGETPSWIKPYAIVIDFCDLSTKHSLLDVPTLFGMKPGANLKGKKVQEETEAIKQEIEQKKLPIRLDEVDSLDTLKAIAVRVNLLAPPKVPDQVRRISRYSWIELSQGGYGLSLPDRTVVRVTEDTLGRYEIAKSINGIKTVVGTANTLDDAIARADGMVPKDAEVLMNGASGWRKKPVSDAQLRMIWRMDFKAQRHFNKDFDEFVRHARQKYPTSGIASDKINELQNTYKPPPWMAKWQAKKEAQRQHAH